MTSYKNFVYASHLYEKDIKEELSRMINDNILKGDGKLEEIEVPVVKIVNAVLEAAVFEQASDIHIEALLMQW